MTTAETTEVSLEAVSQVSLERLGSASLSSLLMRFKHSINVNDDVCSGGDDDWTKGP